MKTLYLIRHAEADWKKAEETDFERTLNNKGVQDAIFIAKKLVGLNFNPERIICSPAKRTTETAKSICHEIDYPIQNIDFDLSIYESSLNNLITLANSLSNIYNEVAIIGHNPSITHLSNYLTNNYIGNMPTCSVVKIELEIDTW
ncbi:MAG: histidine phosphatase family protein, partial [Vicingaceae bacterium]|nr:histidine phosphatase family protein [Vicingaceae bacterium]